MGVEYCSQAIVVVMMDVIIKLIILEKLRKCLLCCFQKSTERKVSDCLTTQCITVLLPVCNIISVLTNKLLH